MNYKIPLALAICSSLVCAPTFAESTSEWRAIAFGQSTDLNFSSNVLAGKIGVNDVTIAGKKLTPETIADLSKPITLESRGGKIANSHDGLTFFYTTLPVGKNFTLQATVRRSVWPGEWRKACGTRGRGLTGARCDRPRAPAAIAGGV